MMISIGSSVLLKRTDNNVAQYHEVNDITIDFDRHGTEYPIQLGFGSGGVYWFGVNNHKNGLSACGSVRLIEESIL